MDLASATGLSRSTVSQRVEVLLRRGVLEEIGNGRSSGGRRPVLLALRDRAGVVLGADVGATHCRLAVATLDGKIVVARDEVLAVTDGPEPLLSGVTESFAKLLKDSGRGPEDVFAIGMGVPGPVEFATGTVVQPPIMPGWDGFEIPRWFKDHLDAPVVVDNDVNVMAIGEYLGGDHREPSLLFVKVSTGIGCGIIIDGAIHRGADGAAGDIGHVRVAEESDTLCTCGNTGCLEAVASGSAIVHDLRDQGLDIGSVPDVVRLAQAGDPRVVRSVRSASVKIGEVLATLVSFYNPGSIVLGGTLAQLSDDLLAGIRSVIYSRALPLATRRLRIEKTSLGSGAGIRGAVLLAAHHALEPAGLKRLADGAASLS